MVSREESEPLFKCPRECILHIFKPDEINNATFWNVQPERNHREHKHKQKKKTTRSHMSWGYRAWVIIPGSSRDSEHTKPLEQSDEYFSPSLILNTRNTIHSGRDLKKRDMFLNINLNMKWKQGQIYFSIQLKYTYMLY